MVSEIHSHLPVAIEMGDESGRTGLRMDEMCDGMRIATTGAERLASI